MNSVSLQMQRAINEAINEQVLPQRQISLRAIAVTFGQQSHCGWIFLVKDRNVNPKILLAGKLEVVLEMS